MPYIAYVEKAFTDRTLLTIEQANTIIGEYQQQGYSLTLRQLYYQMVARGLIPNSDREYKRLGGIVSDARDAGLIDWMAIEDRTRNLRGNPHWDNPVEIVRAAVNSYRIDKWADQPYYPEVWVEKEALAGVVARTCERLDVNYFSCRGYTSASEMWLAGRRLAEAADDGQHPIVFHLGDHDPSGIDMSRDIVDRLEKYGEMSIEVERIALNMDQIRAHNPPPNPAKITDSRYGTYVNVYGRKSWELDALDPNTLDGLIEDAVLSIRNEALWEAAVKREQDGRDALRRAASTIKI